ncbi:MAG: hypothetical protein IPP15_23845 [Saprospiraceae bacterium]|uniref:Uncharacterized protein n=1 Tax=Candidatus Opimibacter skivensis TaxID=2982028 RepID=A0A9D7T035_9BACT|nr:hypothetical protein [Candidatus Opimibacter skivensis]
MTEGLSRFQIQLDKLEQILNTLPNTAECALTFYKSSARQYLFYLEALTHIYKMMHNKKRFERMRISFKSLEDQLGKVDYYDGFIKEFSVQDGFPPILLDCLKQHFNKELTNLDVMLKKDGWINTEESKVKTIKSELLDCDWISDIEEHKAIGKTIIDMIEIIKSDYHTDKLNFKDIENGVHKFRREVRWISIYAQALDGLIQLKPVNSPAPELTTYQTKEVLESPFNVLPALTRGIQPIYIDAPVFYALSWIIAESGRLKDSGLRILILEDAIRETHYVKEKEVKATTRTLAVKSNISLKEIKSTMKIMADKFIDQDKVLDKIINDIRHSIG